MSYLFDKEKFQRFSLIVTPLVQVAEELNSTLSKPRVGKWVYTPKQLVGIGHRRADREELLLELERLIGLEEADFALSTILPAWEEVGKISELRDIFKEHPRKELIFSAIDFLKKKDSIWLARENSVELPNFLDDSKVAVLGEKYLSGLDRSFVLGLEDVENIDLKFSGKKPIIIKTKGKESAISACFELAKRVGENNLAIITGSKEWENLSIFLREADFKVKGPREHLNRHPFVTLFHTLLSQKLEEEKNWDSDLLEIFSHNDKLDHKFTEKLRDFYWFGKELPEETEKIVGKLSDAKSFREIAKLTEEISGDKILNSLKDILEKTELWNEKLTLENFVRFEKYLQLLDRSIKKSLEKEGILLANAKNAVGISRPVQVFLGLDDSWLSKPITKEESWRDAKKEEREAKRVMKSLFSQGEKTICILKESEKNCDVLANPYLLDLLEMERIKDGKPIKNREIKGRNFSLEIKLGEREEREKIKVDESFEIEWSKSTLDNIKSCPKKFFFSRYLKIKKPRSWTAFGSSLHAYAEKRIWEEKGEVEKAKKAELEEKKYEDRFLRKVSPQIRGYEKRRIEKFKKAVERTIEKMDVSVAIPEKKMKGKIEGLIFKGYFDLWFPQLTDILDFKTGKVKKRDDKLKMIPFGRFDPEKNDYFDSQVVAYPFLARLNGYNSNSLIFNFLREGAKKNPDEKRENLRFEIEKLEFSKELLCQICVCKGGRGRFKKDEVGDAESLFLELLESEAEELFNSILKAACCLEKKDVEDGIDKALLDFFSDREFVSKARHSAISYLSKKLIEGDLETFKTYLIEQNNVLKKSLKKKFDRTPKDKGSCDRCDFVSLCGDRGYEDG